MTSTRLFLPTVFLLLIPGVSGCSDGDGDTIIVGGSDEAAISGEWGTTATESLDTCGFDPPPSFEPMLIDEAGDDAVVFVFEDDFGQCVDSVREREGNVVVLEQTDTFVANCGLVEVKSNIIYNFDENSFSGTSRHRYTLLQGNCANLPCDYQMVVAGNRCENCWKGCVSPASAPSPGPHEGWILPRR